MGSDRGSTTGTGSIDPITLSTGETVALPLSIEGTM